MSIPVRPGAAAPPTGAPDPLAPLLDLPGVRAAADAARAGVDRLLGHKVLRRESAGVSTESALRGARASAALEGVDVPLAELRAGAVDDPVVQGALRVSAGLGVDGRHLAAGARPGARPAARAGRERPRRHRRPRPARAARRSPAVRAVLPGHRDDRGAGGDRGRARARRDRRAGPVRGRRRRWSPARPDGSPASPAAWTPRRCRCPRSGSPSWAREAYAEALAGYASGDPAGVARWLVHCCQATEHGALEGLAICESLLRG